MFTESQLPDWWVQSALCKFSIHSRYFAPTVVHIASMLLMTVSFKSLYRIPKSQARRYRIGKTLYYWTHGVFALLTLSSLDGGRGYVALAFVAAMGSLLAVLMGYSTRATICKRMKDDIALAIEQCSKVMANNIELTTTPYGDMSTSEQLQTAVGEKFNKLRLMLEEVVLETYWNRSTQKESQPDRVSTIVHRILAAESMATSILRRLLEVGTVKHCA